MVFPHFQTKNAHTDGMTVAAGETLEYGSVVNFAPAGSGYDVTAHGGGTGAGGVIRSGVIGCIYNAGDMVDVQTTGIAVVKLGEAVSKGAIVGSFAGGLGGLYVPGTNTALGVALHDRAAGEYAEVNMSAKV